MGIDNYKDPIISQWESSGGVKYSKPIVNEPHVVVGGMFALIGLPDVQARVQISGMVEIGFKDKVVDATQFKVDYTNGYVFVHSSKEGMTINTSYSSRGVNMYPASRIYTKVNGSGDVVETMSDWDSKFNSALENETIRITNESTRKSNENARVSAETTRIASEDTRISNEIARVNAEDLREVAEQNRATTFAGYDTRVTTVEDEVAGHKLDYMPHRIQDLKNKKNYNFGFQVSAEGNPQIIYEEVI